MPGQMAEVAGIDKRPGLSVLLGGAMTSAAALWINYWLSNDRDFRFDLMGFYMAFLPMGAIGVGAAAGSGYGLISWWRGVRIGTKLILFVLLMQMTAYWVAEYLQWSQLGHPLGSFFEYFDAATRNISFRTIGPGKDDTGDALGLLGYGVRAMEIAGFSVGGLIAPVVLKSKPYCAACQRYMRTRSPGAIAASCKGKPPSVKHADRHAQWQAQHQAVLEQARTFVEQMHQAMEEENASEISRLMAEYLTPAKKSAKLPVRVQVFIDHCPRCDSSQIRIVQISRQGNRVARHVLAEHPLSPQLLRQIIGEMPT